MIPVRDRPAELDRLLDALSDDLAVVVVDDASADAATTKEIAERHGARLVALDDELRPGRRPQRRPGVGAHPPGGVRRLGLCPRSGLARPAARPLRRPGRRRRGPPGGPAAPPARGRRAALRGGAVLPRPGRRRGARCDAARPSPTSRPRPWSCGWRWRRGPSCSTPPCVAVRTSTSSGAWATPGGTCATSRRAPSSTTARRRSVSSWRRRSFYGDLGGAARPPASRRALPGPRLGVVVGGVAARRARAGPFLAAATLATSVGLLAQPPERPDAATPSPSPRGSPGRAPPAPPCLRWPA